MEQNLAVLIADLTGYTALTETHGPVSAADLIDKYVAIIKNCLVGDCNLHERTGDEVMIISTSPDCLLATSLMIMNETSKEENFLQVHGGLHFGKILKRNNSYFGTVINLTSRIASKADPGTFLCSEEFVNSLSDRSPDALTSKGKHSFKNISGEKEMFEISNKNKIPFLIDPVCRMLILDINKATRHTGSEDIFFCSPDCRDIYIRSGIGNPEVH